jgi:hypothetical protein
VFLRHPLVQRRRQQISRLPIDRPEIAHQNQFVVNRESSPLILLGRKAPVIHQ